MSLLLDTSILIRQQRGDSAVKKELRLLSKLFPAMPSITFINVFEYLLGIKLWTKRKTEAARFLGNFNVINTTEKTPEVMTSLKLKYGKKGLQFSLSDLIIASLAVENDMVLVSSDEDFKDIEELKLQFIDY